MDWYSKDNGVGGGLNDWQPLMEDRSGGEERDCEKVEPKFASTPTQKTGTVSRHRTSPLPLFLHDFEGQSCSVPLPKSKPLRAEFPPFSTPKSTRRTSPSTKKYSDIIHDGDSRIRNCWADAWRKTERTPAFAAKSPTVESTFPEALTSQAVQRATVWSSLRPVETADNRARSDSSNAYDGDVDSPSTPVRNVFLPLTSPRPPEISVASSTSYNTVTRPEIGAWHSESSGSDDPSSELLQLWSLKAKLLADIKQADEDIAQRVSVFSGLELQTLDSDSLVGCDSDCWDLQKNRCLKGLTGVYNIETGSSTAPTTPPVSLNNASKPGKPNRSRPRSSFENAEREVETYKPFTAPSPGIDCGAVAPSSKQLRRQSNSSAPTSFADTRFVSQKFRRVKDPALPTKSSSIWRLSGPIWTADAEAPSHNTSFTPEGYFSRINQSKRQALERQDLVYIKLRKPTSATFKQSLGSFEKFSVDSGCSIPEVKTSSTVSEGSSVSDMANHAPTARTRELPSGDEEVGAELKLGEFQGVPTLTNSEARLLINAIMERRQNKVPTE